MTIQTTIDFDVCANRHGGNAESIAANRRNAATRANQRASVLAACQRTNGVTCRELAEEWNVGMNQISGRFSELKQTGEIYKIGVRNGCGVFRLDPTRHDNF